MKKEGGGVGDILTMADKGGKVGLDPPFLADIICEQPLRRRSMFGSILSISTYNRRKMKNTHTKL